MYFLLVCFNKFKQFLFIIFFGSLLFCISLIDSNVLTKLFSEIWEHGGKNKYCFSHYFPSWLG